MIELKEVTKIYYKGTPREVKALDGVSLRIEKGRMAVLKGPSGSGKTTLLTLAGCLSRPTKGRVFVAGKDISRLQEPFLTLHRRIHVGFIFQQYHLIPDISVQENVLLPLYPLGIEAKRMEEMVEKTLTRLRLKKKKGYRARDLSGGEQQRVAIARALVGDPEIILADEPTANLDSHLSEEFLAVMKGLKEEGKTIVMASHDPLVYEYEGVDMVFDMKDGRLIGCS